MSDDFFKQLNIPHPNINLCVGSGSFAEQTSLIMTRYENLLNKTPTDFCLVVGDVNSTIACSIIAKNFSIPVAHVEAGLRSNDLSMTEEINRIVTDSISDFFFTTSTYANTNLKNLGISDTKIFFVGNTMIDTLIKNKNSFIKPSFFKDKGFLKKIFL